MPRTGRVMRGRESLNEKECSGRLNFAALMPPKMMPPGVSSGSCSMLWSVFGSLQALNDGVLIRPRSTSW